MFLAPTSSPSSSAPIPDVFDLYFPNCDESLKDGLLEVIQDLIKFFSENLFFLRGRILNDGLYIDYSKFVVAVPTKEFTHFLKTEPKLILPILSCCAHEVAATKGLYYGNKLNIRFYNYFPLISMRALKSNYVDHFVCLKGNVVRLSSIKPLVTSLMFECAKCEHKQWVSFMDGKYESPNVCPAQDSRGQRCRCTNFNPVRSEATTVDWQNIRLQEIVSSELIDQGRIPRTIECEVTQDLVDQCTTGDVVVITGIVKARKTEVGKGTKNQCLFVLYIDVTSIDNGHRDNDKLNVSVSEGILNGDAVLEDSDKVEGSGVTGVGGGGMGKLDILQLKEKDLQGIMEICQTPNLFKTLVHSLCPGIYGHEIVKAGIILSLFGGKSRASSRDKLSIRSDPHILIVGDPGLGKSQLLKAAAKTAPRGIYVCGNTTTTAGLTVTMVKDSSGYALEAGALVLADQGCCCIDEFDKMHTEHNALLEAMEQQHISIAKAGVVCSLNARTSVIAAANPVGGHYQRSKTVAENLKIAAPLLSRFDIIFILLDCPDESRDKLLSEHVISLHSNSSSSLSEASPAPSVAGSSFEEGGSSMYGTSSGRMYSPHPNKIYSQTDYKQRQMHETLSQCPGFPQPRRGEMTLAASLQMRPEEINSFEPVPTWLLRKYIAYARNYVHPQLTPEAKTRLQNFYLDLRKEHKNPDGTPITTRQLESMIRLAEARAKLELREIVTDADAADVVECMKESLYDVFSDDKGTMDFGKSSGISKGKDVPGFLQKCKNECRRRDTGGILNRADLVVIAQQSGIRDYDGFLESLNSNGYILKKGSTSYQIPNC